MKTVQVEKCLVSFCKRGGTHGRGLCNTHYMGAAKMVQRKKTTWEKLEKEGKVKSPKRHYKTALQDYFLGDK